MKAALALLILVSLHAKADDLITTGLIVLPNPINVVKADGSKVAVGTDLSQVPFKMKNDQLLDAGNDSMCHPLIGTIDEDITTVGAITARNTLDANGATKVSTDGLTGVVIMTIPKGSEVRGDCQNEKAATLETIEIETASKIDMKLAPPPAPLPTIQLPQIQLDPSAQTPDQQQ